MDFEKDFFTYNELPEKWQKLISLCRIEQIIVIYWKSQKKGSTREKNAYKMLQDIKQKISEIDLFENEQKQN